MFSGSGAFSALMDVTFVAVKTSRAIITIAATPQRNIARSPYAAQRRLRVEIFSINPRPRFVRHMRNGPYIENPRASSIFAPDHLCVA